MSKRASPNKSTPPARGASVVWPLTLPFVRIALVAIAALATAGLLHLIDQPNGPAAVSAFSPLYLLLVNLVCLFLVHRLVRRAGGRLSELIGFRRDRLGKDIAWGFLVLALLYIPFVGAIIGTMFLLYGANAFESFEAVFAADPSEYPTLGFAASLTIALLVVFTFAPVNAPTEELVYRGYAQGQLAARPGWGWQWASVLVPSFAFGLQHIFFATTLPGMLVYGVAFFVWGIGSALIYRWQGRLMPLIVAHLLVNLFTSAPALIVPFLN